MRLVVALLLLSPIASCIGEDGDESYLEEKRVLESGQQSGHTEASRAVLTTETAWAEFWSVHGSRQSPPPERPFVDFEKERVVAVMMGEKADGCWAVRTGDVTARSQHSVVAVVIHGPAPGTGCAAVVTYPYEIIAIPNRASRVVFEDRTVEGPPPA